MAPPAAVPAVPVDYYADLRDQMSKALTAAGFEVERAHEVDPIRFRPHPHEFELYFDI